VLAAHKRFRIDQQARDAWVHCMEGALDETVADEGARDQLRRYFNETATQLINQGPSIESRYGQPLGEAGGSPDELECSWSLIKATEAAERSIQAGDREGLLKVLPRCQELESLMLLAAEHGRQDLMRELKEGGADATKTCVGGELLVDQPDAARLLLNWGARFVHATHQPSLIAACRGDRRERVEQVRALLAHGADVNVRSTRGRTALHYAARAGFVETARTLIAAGAEIEAVDEDGRTPLWHARRCEQAEIIRLLTSLVTGLADMAKPTAI
jgi:hypothetical protein